jgi:hypothetical protein
MSDPLRQDDLTLVMPAHSGIHALLCGSMTKAWMPGPGPGMTQGDRDA